MHRVQISFLGVGFLQDPSNKASSDYQRTSYEFSDGRAYETRSFMEALARWQHERDVPVSRMVVVGTATSLWMSLMELEGFPEEAVDAMEAIDAQTRDPTLGTTQAALDALAEQLHAHLGYKLVPLIIGRCDSEQKQLKLAERLTACVPTGAELVLDVTHSYRHLPMIAISVAHYLTHARGCHIDQIYYGMRGGKGEPATVVEFGGLLRIMRVGEALAMSRERGSLTPIAATYGEALTGVEEAAYLLDTMQLGRSRKACKAALKEVNESTQPLVRIARDELCEALRWPERQGTVYERQLDRGRRALAAQDYNTCVTMLMECLYTAALYQCQPDGQADPDNIKQRDKGKDWLYDWLQAPSRKDHRQRFHTLREVRNALAHGTRPAGGDSQSILSSRANLEQFLGECVAWIPRLWTEMTKPPSGRA